MTKQDKQAQAMQTYLQAGARDVAAYLRTLPNVFDVQPCVIVIKGGHHSAARYKQTCQTPEGTRAWQEGQREYVNEMIYAVGMLPACKRNGNVCFTVEGDAREWYVAGYGGQVVKRVQAVWRPSKFHPFGNSFLLAPWTPADMHRIDYYERVPYKRVSLAIQNAGEG